MNRLPSRAFWIGAVLVSTVAGLSYCAVALPPPPDPAAMFPDAAGPAKPDGDPRPLQGGRSNERVLLSYRFKPLPDRTEAVGAIWCGAVLRDPPRPPIALVTIGKDFTEALSCAGLSAAETMPPSGAAARIALLYRTASPNASGTTAIILVQDPSTQAWSVDAALSQRLADSAEPTTMAAIRRALTSSR